MFYEYQAVSHRPYNPASLEFQSQLAQINSLSLKGFRLVSTVPYGVTPGYAILYFEKPVRESEVSDRRLHCTFGVIPFEALQEAKKRLGLPDSSLLQQDQLKNLDS